MFFIVMIDGDEAVEHTNGGGQTGLVLPMIRPCTDFDVPNILQIINASAVAYHGVIPADCWHEPYMPLHELRAEIAAGVHFTGYQNSVGALVGVRGIQ